MLVEFRSNGYAGEELWVKTEDFMKAKNSDTDYYDLMMAINSFYRYKGIDPHPFNNESFEPLWNKLGKSGVLIFCSAPLRFSSRGEMAQLDLSISNNRENVVYFDDIDNQYRYDDKYCDNDNNEE